MNGGKYTENDAKELLRRKYAELAETGETRFPKRADFSDEQVVAIKSYLGPWPRALEAAGIKEPRDGDRIEKNREKRRRAKQRRRDARRGSRKRIRLTKRENRFASNIHPARTDGKSEFLFRKGDIYEKENHISGTCRIYRRGACRFTLRHGVCR
ncbi:MAG: hypothetical protein LUI15_08565 [Firmicutes bacterium]|nr:hypothetical protein [Bacillota bacterium]